MECPCVRSSQLPHATKLFAAYLDDFQRLARFFAHPPSEDGVRAAAREARVEPNGLAAVIAALREQNRRFGADAATQKNLDRLAAGAVAVVTGQQVGLFSGPAYSFYKALSAIRLADGLTRSGIPAVPVFWLATEDHDLAEVDHCFFFAHGGLARLEWPFSSSAAGRRVGEIPLGEAAGEVVRVACDLLEGPAAETVARALREAYQPRHTLGSAFAVLMLRLLAGRGVILLDPLDPPLHRLAAPVYRRALERSAAFTEALLARDKELDRAGFHSQVKVTQRSTLLFINQDGRRIPLRRREPGFAAGDATFSQAELEQAIERTPEAFSANVLLRPVVQDMLLPTSAYVAGPAEVAYFAQASVLYREMQARMPAIVHRAGFTLVEPESARLLAKYGLEVSDLFRGRQHLRRAMERRFLPQGLQAKFAAGEKTLGRLLRALRRPMEKLDPTLVGALETSERKMRYQLTKLQGQAGRAANSRSGVLDRHERVLVDSLYPNGDLQERTLNLLPALARHSLKLLDELERSAATSTGQHRIVYL